MSYKDATQGEGVALTWLPVTVAALCGYGGTMPTRVYVLAFLLVGLSACAPTTDATDEPRLLVARPGIEFGHIGDIWMRDGGIVDVFARVSEIGDALNEDVYVEALVETSGGDRETIRLSRAHCDVNSPPGRECNLLVVRVKSGETLEALASVLAGPFGALLIEDRGESGAFYVRQGLRRAASLAKLHPRVSEVGYVPLPVACLGICSPPETALRGVLPFFHGTHTLGDGIIHASPGDTIVLRYEQPGGDTLTTSTVVPTIE